MNPWNTGKIYYVKILPNKIKLTIQDKEFWENLENIESLNWTKVDLKHMSYVEMFKRGTLQNF